MNLRIVENKEHLTAAIDHLKKARESIVKMKVIPESSVEKENDLLQSIKEKINLMLKDALMLQVKYKTDVKRIELPTHGLGVDLPDWANDPQLWKIFSKVIDETGMEPQFLVNEIVEKVDSVSGLLTRLGALLIIADKNHVNVDLD